MSGEKLVLRDADERELWREMLVAATVSPRQSGVDGKESSIDQYADVAVIAYRQRCGTPDRFESLYKGIPFSKLTPEQLNEMKRTVFGTSEPVASDPEIRVVEHPDWSGYFSVQCGEREAANGIGTDVTWWPLGKGGRYLKVAADRLAAELRAARNFPKSGGGA